MNKIYSSRIFRIFKDKKYIWEKPLPYWLRITIRRYNSVFDKWYGL